MLFVNCINVYLKNTSIVERLSKINLLVFDKTGTLTTGHFSVAQFKILDGTSEADFKSLVYALEKYSNHPIAKCISLEWKTNTAINWAKIEEVKGMGIKATDKEGNEYWAGSFKTLRDQNYKEDDHNIYIQLLA